MTRIVPEEPKTQDRLSRLVVQSWTVIVMIHIRIDVVLLKQMIGIPVSVLKIEVFLLLPLRQDQDGHQLNPTTTISPDEVIFSNLRHCLVTLVMVD